MRNAAAVAERIGEPTITSENLADLAFIEMLRGQPHFQQTMDRALALERSPGRRCGRRVGSMRSAVAQRDGAWPGPTSSTRHGRVLLELQAKAGESGHEHVLPYLLNWLGRVACFAGNWRDGYAWAREAYDASVQAGLEVERPYTLGDDRARPGSPRGRRRHIERDRRRVGARAGMEVVPAQLELLAVKGFLELSLGEREDAHITLAALAEPGGRRRVRPAGCSALSP